MIFFCGDIHGDCSEIESFCEDKPWLNPDTDIMVLLGDVGANYHLNPRDTQLKQRMAQLPLTFFCIHGNHEVRPSFELGYQVMQVFNGECLYQPEYPNLLFPLDGNVYQLPTGASDTPVISVLVMGGAYSVDKFYRLKHGWSWFADEQPSEYAKEQLWNSLKGYSNQVDVVATHTCPFSQRPVECFLPGLDQSTVDTSTEEFLEEVYQRCNFEHWVCGHWHTDKVVCGENGKNVHFLYKDIISLY